MWFPFVIGVLGSVIKKFEKWLEKLQLDANISVVQKTTLLGTAQLPSEKF